MILFTLNFRFAHLALLSKKVNKLLRNILVTLLPKTPKTYLPKWDETLIYVDSAQGSDLAPIFGDLNQS